MTHVRFGIRGYDHLTPLALGEVTPESFTLEIVRCDRTPDLGARTDLDGAEASASRVIGATLAGDRRLVPAPAFVLSAFRHRCLITRRDSDLVSIDQLRNRRVGLTGWPDTGQVWTRALFADAGIAPEEVEWFVGPVTGSDPVLDRIGPAGAPSTVGELPAGSTLLGGLSDGSLDVLMLPTLPASCYGPDAPFRHLIPDLRAAETAYFRRLGFVPGIHLAVVRAELAEIVPDLVDALARSYDVWFRRRIALLDTTPGFVSELAEMAATVGLDWNPYREAHRAVEHLGHLMVAQGLADRPASAAEIFTEALSCHRDER